MPGHHYQTLRELQRQLHTLLQRYRQQSLGWLSGPVNRIFCTVFKRLGVRLPTDSGTCSSEDPGY